jgi:AcrR family transcriptional regulator
MEEMKQVIGKQHSRMSGDERRTLILAQAKKIFAQQGYHETSTGELARACGITEPILYKHFGSKKRLYLAVLNMIVEQFFTRFKGLVDKRAEKDVFDSLSFLLLDYRTAAMEDHDNIHLLLNATLDSNDGEVTQITQAHNRDMYALVNTLLEKAQQKGLISQSLDLSAATWGYLSLLFALQYRAKANLFNQFNEQNIREINRLWLQALQTG